MRLLHQLTGETDADPSILPWTHALTRVLYALIPVSFACGLLGVRLPFRRRASPAGAE